MQRRELVNDQPSHIVLLVVDGLGGYVDGEHQSELEEASAPNLDRQQRRQSARVRSPRR